MRLLLIALLAGQPVVTPPDPPATASEPEAAGGAAASAPAQPSAPASQPAAAIQDDDPAEEPEFEGDATPTEPDSASQPASEPAPAVEPTPEPDVEDAMPAAAPAPDDATPAPAAPCPARETADTLRLTGLVVGGVSLLAAAGLIGVSLYERAQAQDLLDHSPAFGKVGDRYVERDPTHPDVATYDTHRAVSSILSQLSWFALGLGLGGAGVAGSALWLGEQAEACQAR